VKVAAAGPTEAVPVEYRVKHQCGAVVGSGHDTASARLGTLTAGQVTCVVELVGRCARITTSMDRWVSTERQDGVPIMQAYITQSTTSGAGCAMGAELEDGSNSNSNNTL